MSCNYADGLSPYENKGEVGMPEFLDDATAIEEKSKQLARFIRNSSWTVLHTGAGISTASGIPDFRGPNGVWTLEKMGKKPTINVSFDTARPTYTHRAIYQMVKAEVVQFVVNQNIDGLHLKAGTPDGIVADMHGNVFVEKCHKCRKQYIRETSVPTVGLKFTGSKCPYFSGYSEKLHCRGKMKDTILDWEDELPEKELNNAIANSKKANLSVTLGTSLQILPCNEFPLLTKKNNGKLVIINLQQTPLDKDADLRIYAKVDEVMKIVCNELNLEVS
ncbi:NAD-dependent protein deacylase sirtuin-6-like [Convolutriloba macropyga]|uniref:NAD-dependent protein deacylase sirtuin-6-like n=1 Tax=Convolutriloba macropyga TaxID=536237 RepID=UPI003F5226BC